MQFSNRILLHCNGIYHNDIKPSNILIGNFGQAQLADYGISGVDATAQSLSITPKNAYKIHRAPETASKIPVINPQTEVYQVGVTAFRLLNGISLVKDDFLNMSETDFNNFKAIGKLPRKSDHLQFIPRSLKAVVNKALVVDTNNRFKTALEMRRRLENLAFSVCWTCDNAGELIGEGQKYTYSLQETNSGKNKFHLECLKKSKSSGRETRISRFCGKNLSFAELNKLKGTIFQWTTNEGN